jgi:GH25 family lysozyme M1 (1,4-beta-N-acetylmuramidase)
MALDLESVMENDIEQWGVLPEQQRYDQLQSFLSFITAKGFTDIIIYSTKDFIDTYLPNATFLAQYKLWLAEYAPQVNGLPKFWTKWNYWQYTDRGIVGGVPEPIDCSYENEEV